MNLATDPLDQKWHCYNNNCEKHLYGNFDEFLGTSIKPPLGVMPKEIWEEKRMKDLSRAICEYINVGLYPKVLSYWLSELETLTGWARGRKENE